VSPSGLLATTLACPRSSPSNTRRTGEKRRERVEEEERRKNKGRTEEEFSGGKGEGQTGLCRYRLYYKKA